MFFKCRLEKLKLAGLRKEVYRLPTSDFRLLSMINVVKNNNTCTRFTEIEADKLISN